MTNIRSKVEEYFLESLSHRTERLVKLIQLGSPLPILAYEVWLIFLAGMGLAPKYLANHLGDWMHGRVRNSAGFCESCDNRILTSETHPLMCEECDKRLEMVEESP